MDFVERRQNDDFPKVLVARLHAATRNTTVVTQNVSTTQYHPSQYSCLVSNTWYTTRVYMIDPEGSMRKHFFHADRAHEDNRRWPAAEFTRVFLSISGPFLYRYFPYFLPEQIAIIRQDTTRR